MSSLSVMPAPVLATWRLGFQLQLSGHQLAALERGLRLDDPGLIQGATTEPPPLACVADWPIEAADPLVYALWRAGDLETIGQAEERWAQACCRADEALGECGRSRYFLNWWDETPREEARQQLLAEVQARLQTVAAEYQRAAQVGIPAALASQMIPF